MNVENRPDKVTFKVYGEEASTLHYFDDGNTMEYKEGKYNLSRIKCSKESISIDYIHQGIDEEKVEFVFIK